jgi:general nucleoside transport system permease protein
MEEWILTTIVRGLALGTPLVWAALGEVYAERSGVVNLGVEGMMVLGAFAAFAVAQSTGHPYLGLLFAAGAGTAAGMVHAVLVISLRANQYVSGLALTMFGLGLSALLGRRWEGLPLLATLPEISLLTYGGLGMGIVLWFILYHTRWGIILRSAGEAPAAVDSLGVNVFRVRYLAVAFGGALAGIGGGLLSVAYRPSWTEGVTVGLGWIAISIAIFASWDPLRAVAGAFLFGALFHLSFRLQTWIAPEPLQMMPFAFTILVLALASARRRAGVQGAPEALGLPYVRGER